MKSPLAKTVKLLEARRAALQSELLAVEARLIAVAEAVQQPIDQARARGAQRIGPRGPASAGTTPRLHRSWFKRNEAVGLLRQLAKTPKAPSELVREVGVRKGYGRTLSVDDRRRFQGAVYMAITQALKTKALRRTPKGQVVAAGAN